MTKMFELGMSRRCQLWQNEMPTVCFDPVEIHSERVPVDGNVIRHRVNTCAALELVVPRGARSLYGLLAFEYLADESSNELVIEVGTGKPNGRWETALVGAFDDALIGLPREYAEYVLVGMTAAVRESLSPASGVLRCTCAVHALASSNGPVFRQLARALTMLMFGGGEPVDEVRLMELLSL